MGLGVWQALSGIGSLLRDAVYLWHVSAWSDSGPPHFLSHVLDTTPPRRLETCSFLSLVLGFVLGFALGFVVGGVGGAVAAALVKSSVDRRKRCVLQELSMTRQATRVETAEIYALAEERGGGRSLSNFQVFLHKT